MDGIFGRNNLPSALGSKDFLDWVKGSFFYGKRHKEVPDSKNLSPDAERIKEERMRGKIFGDRQLKRRVEEIKTTIYISQA